MTRADDFKQAARPIFGTVSGQPTTGFRIAVTGKRRFQMVSAMAENYGGIVAPNTGRYPQLMRITFAADAAATEAK